MSEKKPGDWVCHCGALNFASRTKCRDCDDFKSKSVPQLKKFADWTCECGEINFSSRIRCRKCTKTKTPTNNDKSQPKLGDWVCGCGELNFSSRTNCRKCSKEKNSSSNTSNGTSNLSNSITNTIVYEARLGDWKCTNCNSNKLNFASRTHCVNCGLLKLTSPNTNTVSKPEDTKSALNNEIKENNIATEDDSRLECRICMERPISIVFTGCGHMTCCDVCCYAMDKCPMCRKKYTESQILKVYIS